MSAIAKFVKSQTKILLEHNAEIANKLTEELGLNDEQVATMKEALKTGVEEMAELKKFRRGGKKGPTRAPTEYNIFVKNKIAELKASDPSIDRKDLMIKAAAAWSCKKKAATQEVTAVIREPKFTRGNVRSYYDEDEDEDPFIIRGPKFNRGNVRSYYDEDGDPFDADNAANWDGDQQIGFRDRD